MMKITGLSHLFKWENLHNWWLTKYFFAPLYMESSVKCAVPKHQSFKSAAVTKPSELCVSMLLK